ncbi:MAG: uridine kinase [Streptococcaceae bacterium]|jgi:uridine kinase|nr:uridine kinase [Streptococcaceae bacterium]
MKKKPIIIGVSGGSGSGKTTVSRAILDNFPEHSITVIEHDSYYKNQDEMTFEERLKTNYDHPLAFDTNLLVKQLTALREYKAIDIPVYDYVRHTRSDKVLHQEPVEVIIVEGILIFEDKRLRKLMDIKIFVDTDDDVRIIRRIQRDMIERGRSLESVIDQYLSSVKPAYHQFIEPTKRYADVILPDGGRNYVAIDLINTKIANVFKL